MVFCEHHLLLRIMSAGIFVNYGNCLRGITVDRNDSPGFAGAVLYAKFQTIEKIEKLLALGDLMELHENIKPVPSLGHYILLENDVVKEVRLQEGVCVSKSRDIRNLEGNVIKKGVKVKLREYKGTNVIYPFMTEGLNYIYVFDKEKGQWKTYGLSKNKKTVEELKIRYETYIRNLVYRDDISDLTPEEKANLKYVK